MLTLSMLMGTISLVLYVITGDYIKEVSPEPKDAWFELVFILAFIVILYPIYIVDKLLDIIRYKKLPSIDGFK